MCYEEKIIGRVMFNKYLLYCVRSVRSRSFSGPYFPSFTLNTERYSVSLRIQSKCWKMQTRKTPNTETCYAVLIMTFLYECVEIHIANVFKYIYRVDL